MGFLVDLSREYARSASQHTGLHYVPSFNDLNSGSNDDLEEEVLQESQAQHSDQQRQQQQGSPLNMPAGMAASTMVAGGKPLARMSNKPDDSSPGFDPYPDIHRINRHTTIDGRKQWLYDVPKGPRPTSVWEEILRATSAPSPSSSPSSSSSSSH